MLIDEAYRKCVVFLVADIPDPDSGVVRRPVASAFFVGVRLAENVDAWAVHLVTARHVIDQSRRFGALYARVNRMAGGYSDLRADQDQWITHPKTDVAVRTAYFAFDDHDFRWIPVADLASDDYVQRHRVGEGDDVFFTGLFTEQPGFERSQPIIRFGNIALMPREKIGIRMSAEPDAPVTKVDAYLVEARSWGGHSGSPAFIYFPLDRAMPSLSDESPGPKVLTLPAGVRPLPPALLGLVQGHYEIQQDVAFIGDILGSGKVPVNAGIAVVIPAQEVIDTLNDPRLVDERRDHLRRLPKPETASSPEASMPPTATKPNE